METKAQKIKLAVNGGIHFGSRLNAKQLITLAKYLGPEDSLELTTFQQLYLEIDAGEKESIVKELQSIGLSCYPVGNYVKSLRTCNFCKGELEEGMPVAKEINRRFAGVEVPFTLKMAYTGCPVGCGEPLMNDVGIMKKGDSYAIYIGGKSKGEDARAGVILFEDLLPDELYVVIQSVLEIYKNHAKKRENFAKFVARFSVGKFREEVLRLIGNEKGKVEKEDGK